MKKIFILLISAMFVFSACNSGASKQHDFFDIDLGMSEKKLYEIKGEPRRKIETPKYTFYHYTKQEMFGMSNVVLGYTIGENGIVGCSAGFNSSFDNDASYQEGYYNLKEIMISEWGEPIKIIENDTDLKYLCSWGNKNIVLYKSEVEGDIIVTFEINALHPDYLEENPFVTEYWPTE